MPETTSTLDIVTLVIAVLGLVAAAISLVWQIVSWRLTGPVVKVSVSMGVLVGVSGPGHAIISITARNVGRSNVSIGAWGLRLPNGERLIVPIPEAWAGPRVPYTLMGGHSESWRMDHDEVHQSLIDAGLPGGRRQGRRFARDRQGHRL